MNRIYANWIKTMEKPLKLKIAITTSALFDLSEENRIYEEQGVPAYIKHMEENRNKPLKPGPLFALVKLLSNINYRIDPQLGVENRVVDFVLASRNDPVTAERAMQAINENNLSVDTAFFLSGESPVEFIQELDIDFFATTREDDVLAARKANIPAGHVLPDTRIGDTESTLRLAFDFDRVMADGSAEEKFEEGGLESFIENDIANHDKPMAKGPLFNFVQKLERLSKLENEFTKTIKDHQPALKLHIITSRGVKGSRQFSTSLREWGIRPENTFMCGGTPKTKVLEKIKPHLFIDDKLHHLEPHKSFSTCVHIPYLED